MAREGGQLRLKKDKRKTLQCQKRKTAGPGCQRNSRELSDLETKGLRWPRASM